MASYLYGLHHLSIRLFNPRRTICKTFFWHSTLCFMVWQSRKTLKINEEISIRPDSHTPTFHAEIQNLVFISLKKKKKSTSVGITSDLTAWTYEPGRLSTTLSWHMGTTHHHMLVYRPATWLERRHSPYVGICVHPGRSLITQSDICMKPCHVECLHIVWEEMLKFQSHKVTCRHLRNLWATSRK